MGWTSGSQLAEQLWVDLRCFIPENERCIAAKRLIKAFEKYDCDTLDECELLQRDAYNCCSLCSSLLIDSFTHCALCGIRIGPCCLDYDEEDLCMKCAADLDDEEDLCSYCGNELNFDSSCDCE